MCYTNHSVVRSLLCLPPVTNITTPKLIRVLVNKELLTGTVLVNKKYWPKLFWSISNYWLELFLSVTSIFIFSFKIEFWKGGGAKRRSPVSWDPKTYGKLVKFVCNYICKFCKNLLIFSCDSSSICGHVCLSVGQSVCMWTMSF